MMESRRAVHLLWPTQESKQMYAETKGKVDEAYIKNLGLERIADDINLFDKYRHDTRSLIYYLCDDAEVITYRLHILEDFLNHPQMAESLKKLIPFFHDLENEKVDLYSRGADQFRKVAWRLDKLHTYITCVEDLNRILLNYKSELKSEGLLKLCQYITTVMRNDTYLSLKEKLPEFRKQLQDMSFVTIGINLDHTLEPTEAVFLSVEPKPFKKPSILSNFLGLKSADEDFEGISQFYSISSQSSLKNTLFRELGDIFEETITPISTAIREYTRVNTRTISDLAFEFSFYIGASQWIKRLKGRGLSMCQPIARSKEERSCQIENLRDVILSMNALDSEMNESIDEMIISNDVTFDSDGRIFILTGPNQGGKTTYTRSIGLAQVLFQVGLYIPGTSASMSPVDWVYTHFNEEERPNVKDGRLGEESERLARVFDQATSYSLVLLNESFSSTSPGEGLYLAEDIIKGLIIVGSRAVFATHFHELAARVEKINADFMTYDNRLISMVAGVERSDDPLSEQGAKRTYKVVPSPPQGMSYARDIARLYGISLEQIKEKLAVRGQTDENSDLKS